MGVQLVLNIALSTLFFLSGFVSIFLLWKIWQALMLLIDMMSNTIIDNSKRNVESIHHLSEAIDKQEGKPPEGS